MCAVCVCARASLIGIERWQLKCNLNTLNKPAQTQGYKDYMFCSKKVVDASKFGRGGGGGGVVHVHHHHGASAEASASAQASASAFASASASASAWASANASADAAAYAAAAKAYADAAKSFAANQTTAVIHHHYHASSASATETGAGDETTDATAVGASSGGTTEYTYMDSGERVVGYKSRLNDVNDPFGFTRKKAEEQEKRKQRWAAFDAFIKDQQVCLCVSV